MILLKNLYCYCPQYKGINDILICADKIVKIQPQIKLSDTAVIDKTIECKDTYAMPGFIDQHVHILGGGGEGGFASRIKEIDISDILNAGVTTLVGLLGADGITRNLEALFAKAKALEAQGITTYIYSGSYCVPPATFTKNVVSDLVLIDKVIGVGEIAISDHRSSYPTQDELLRVASEVHLGGLLGGKAGVLHLHLGDGKDGLTPLLNLTKCSDLPIEEFVPTHVNRNKELFRQAEDYNKTGGHIDLTSGETAGITVPNAICRLLKDGMNMDNVTVSSDANGSIPNGEICKIKDLYDDIIATIKEKGINPETVISLVTENVAKLLKIYPQKGVLQEGSDADIIIADKNFCIKKLFSKGKMLIEYI